ncbi:uncharacterized protein LOC142587466 isoform X3 [Dermacentor variabilis]|uniref:uncharacterized protein LOC142587466 isoform X3 n=1 Tax=Dermacentor variabilis TaxID=34621 RepID=UPI003F5C987B
MTLEVTHIFEDLTTSQAQKRARLSSSRGMFLQEITLIEQPCYFIIQITRHMPRRTCCTKVPIAAVVSLSSSIIPKSLDLTYE